MTIKRWSVAEIISQIRSCAYDCGDMRMDGYYQWGCKQDLYAVKFVLDELINRCPTFEPEAEWLDEQEKERIINILSRKT